MTHNDSNFTIGTLKNRLADSHDRLVGDNPFFPIRKGRGSVRRCIISLALLETVVITAIVSIAFATAAFAFEPGKTDRIGADDTMVLAYANENAGPGNPFSDDIFLDTLESEDGHPLNDAWMGMSVVTADGVNAGYVSDAFLDETGAVVSVVITPSDDSGLRKPMEVSSRYVLLGNAAVTIDMTLATLKSQKEFDTLAYNE